MNLEKRAWWVRRIIKYGTFPVLFLVAEFHDAAFWMAGVWAILVLIQWILEWSKTGE